MRLVRDGLLLLGAAVAGPWLLLAPAPELPAVLVDGPQPAPAAGGPIRLEGLRLDVDALGGRTLHLQAARGEPIEPELGPFSLGGVATGLLLRDVLVEAQGLRIRAERLELTPAVLRCGGAVRAEDGEGRGLLFGPELELARDRDWLRAAGPCVLGPDPLRSPEQAPGRGGRLEDGFSGTWAELRAASVAAGG